MITEQQKKDIKIIDEAVASLASEHHEPDEDGEEPLLSDRDKIVLAMNVCAAVERLAFDLDRLQTK
jgi:hypothetical protein